MRYTKYITRKITRFRQKDREKRLNMGRVSKILLKDTCICPYSNPRRLETVWAKWFWLMRETKGFKKLIY